MNDEGLKKFTRIIAILTQLQSKRVVRAQDLANRFEVSLRTIYRDIRSLEQTGVPIISEAGVGYSIMEGYHLPPIMFSKAEILSFITAEKLTQKLTDQSIGEHYDSAMIKLKSVLRLREKEFIEHIDGQIEVRTKKTLSTQRKIGSLEIILRSITEKKQISLVYKAGSDKITQRNIEVVGVFYENDFWYVLGYCLLRKEYRQFRTDRILEIKETALGFSHTHGDLSDYKTDYITGIKYKVRIRVDKKIVRFLENSKMSFGLIAEEKREDVVEMTFITADIEEGFPRWFLSFADYATILEPEVLKENTQRLLQRIQERLQKS